MPADGENQRGHDQAPEIELLQATEQVASIGWPLALLGGRVKQQYGVPLSTSLGEPPQDSMAEEPVRYATTNFITAMPVAAWPP
jgi:hypothetical protein